MIHEHYASTHHFDLRLEQSGTLWSWALPKGVPDDPARNRLAVRVEDHDLDHIDFVDDSPVAGEPPGTIAKSIWDGGTYTVVRSTPEHGPPTKMVLDLHGDRTRGRFSLFCTGGTQWMIHRMEAAG